MAMRLQRADNEAVLVKVKYDGPAVASGRMDARQLAPAMLATAHLFEHTASMMYGANTGLRIEVDANFRRGSFEYDLLTSLVRTGQTLLGNLSVSDVIGVGTLLFLAVKQARGRKPAKVVTEPQPTIIFQDGDNITVNVHVARLFLNTTIRQDLHGAIEPLLHDGVDDFVISGPEHGATIVRGEADYFDAPVTDEQVLKDDVSEDIVHVLAPHFTEGNKWQFSLAGEGVFWARILDKKFLDQVRRHEVTFGSGDALRVRMKVRVVRKPDGQYTRDREIVEVLDRMPNAPPPDLFGGV